MIPSEKQHEYDTITRMFCEHQTYANFTGIDHFAKQNLKVTSVQAGAVLMPLAMFLLSLKSIRVLY